MTDLTGKHGLDCRRRQQAVDRVGDRAGGGARRRPAGGHLSGRAARGERPRALAPALTDPLILPCDVTDDAQIADVFAAIERGVRRPRLRRPRRRVRAARGAAAGSRSCRRRAKASGCRSTSAPIRWLRWRAGRMPLMERRGGGSILTLTYLGSERVFQNYNVMGVAKAALEASRPLSRRRSRAEEHPRQRHLGRPDQDARGFGHLRLLQHSAGLSRSGAAAADGRNGRGGGRRDVPARPGRPRGHGRSPHGRRRISRTGM